MSSYNVIGRIANVSKTKAEWTSSDPVLNSGEIGYESDTGNWKLGDGTSKWSELNYRGIKEIIIDSALSDTSANPVQNAVITNRIVPLESRMTNAENKISSIISDAVIYGFQINPGESSPSAAVTYLLDAIGMTPAHMDYTTGTFNYGSWENAFFMPRPCMVKYDGTVDYYLDPNDYSKKEDGTTDSDIANTDYEGNAMMEWGRNGEQIWYRVEPYSYNNIENIGARVYISNRKINDDYHCWSFIDSEGNIKDHFYTSIYNGSKITGSDSVVRLRSLSGQMPCHNTTPANEATYAMANATDSSKVSWYIATYADMILISFLLTLIGKSLDTQTVFGYGCASDYDDTHPTGSGYYGIHASGETNDKGLFWGSNVTTKGSCKPVKVFGMENYWGNLWQRIAGLVNDHGVEKVKLTWGTEDGSTGTGYQLGSSSVTGFLTVCNAPTSGGYVKYWYYTPYGAAVQYNTSGGSASTYYCDYSWWANTNLFVAIFGGYVSSGSICGSWCVSLSASWSRSSWVIGASPSLR